MKKIIVTYVNRETNCPAGYMTFSARSMDEACVLAANYQSRHPELKDVNFQVVR